MSKPASRAQLGGLHAKITELFDKTLDDWLNPSESTLPPTAADIGCITKFLKDNDITADPGDDNALDALQEKMNQLKQKTKQANIIAQAGSYSTELQ